ncbi:hypothetical protein [Methanococcoides sp. FTZ1]|uniref:hypothetical protein n=1 Tax=Methanococcoides sp. FTZ1 TaxID=3439061 RepID=UPI003F86F54A
MKKITSILIIILIISTLGMGCVGSDKDTYTIEKEDQLITEEQSLLLTQKQERVEFVNEAIDLID